jgi:hypothetical protein
VHSWRYMKRKQRSKEWQEADVAGRASKGGVWAMLKLGE